MNKNGNKVVNLSKVTISTLDKVKKTLEDEMGFNLSYGDVITYIAKRWEKSQSPKAEDWIKR